jgi:hypothetical protein
VQADVSDSAQVGAMFGDRKTVRDAGHPREQRRIGKRPGRRWMGSTRRLRRASG